MMRWHKGQHSYLWRKGRTS